MASKARHRQDSAVQIFLLSCKNSVFEFRGKARISSNILFTHPNQSAATRFEIFPATIALFLLQNHCDTLAFDFSQVPCTAQDKQVVLIGKVFIFGINSFAANDVCREKRIRFL